MGAAGRARVAQMFDWPVVAAGYDALIDELAAIRAAEGSKALPPGGLDPVRGDPFRDFAGFATDVMDDDTPLAIAAGATLEALQRTQTLELDRAYGGFRANLAECSGAFKLIETGKVSTVGQVLARIAPERRQAMQLGLIWMCKRGLLDWL